MKNLLKRVQNSGSDLLKLTKTQPISQFRDESVREFLNGCYDHEDPAMRAFGVVINAVLTEGKAEFPLSLNLVQSLIDHTTDLRKKPDLRARGGKTYGRLTRFLDKGPSGEGQVARIVVQSRKNCPKPAVLQVVDPEILERCGGTSSERLQNCLEVFANRAALENRKIGNGEMDKQECGNRELEIERVRPTLSSTVMTTVPPTAPSADADEADDDESNDEHGSRLPDSFDHHIAEVDRKREEALISLRNEHPDWDQERLEDELDERFPY